MFDGPAEAVLKAFMERLDAENALMRDGNPKELMGRRDEFLLAVGPETGRFLHSLITARGATHIVELGTSYGFSTLFLADAARRTGGRVATFEAADYKMASAQEALKSAGLHQYVDWHLGDAVTLLEDLAGNIDFVLLDIWKELYVPCFDSFYPKLAENAVVAADNMLFPPEAAEHTGEYSDRVCGKSDLQSVLLPIGSGIELSVVWGRKEKA